jgi:hypothetical protein
MNNTTFEVCQEYARLLCAIRERPDDTGLKGGVHMLLEMAPEEARYHLDTIKRIMEIDQNVTNPEVVLMRASVL